MTYTGKSMTFYLVPEGSISGLVLQEPNGTHGYWQIEMTGGKRALIPPTFAYAVVLEETVSAVEVNIL